MTTETITGLRQLLDRANDSEDIEFLRAVLVAVDAVDANGQPDEARRCAKCKRMWPGLKLDGDGVCPNCLLDALYLRQRTWRKANYLED